MRDKTALCQNGTRSENDTVLDKEYHMLMKTAPGNCYNGTTNRRIVLPARTMASHPLQTVG